MGAAMEIVTGRATNPGATFTAVTPGTQDSLTVRNCDLSSRIRLMDLWSRNATGGLARIRSPRMHDNVQGLRVIVPAGEASPLLSDQFDERLFPQDTLTVEVTGGGAETDVVTMLVYYDDLPGISARLMTWAEAEPRIEHLLGVECDLTTGATVGDYGGGQILTSNFDVLKANTDYAILGYVLSTGVAAIGFRGPDFGNLRVGGPGVQRPIETRDWFVRQSQVNGIPFIPVFNSANKGTTFIDCVHTAAGTAIVVSVLLAQLR